MLVPYAEYLRHLVGVQDIRPLKVVIDAGNGMAGYTAPAVLGGLPLDITELYFELDGNFPNHEANPIDPANMVDTQRAVLEVGADIGLAFDGDADRCFVVDERGEIVNPSTLTALIASLELAKAPGAPVIHNLITSRAVPEVIRENGGTLSEPASGTRSSRPRWLKPALSSVGNTLATSISAISGEPIPGCLLHCMS